MKTICKSCSKTMEAKKDRENICDDCYRDIQEAIEDYEADKQYQERNQHWDIY